MITESDKETQRFAGDLVKKLIQKKLNKALVVALEGELGSGKTTFTKGFSKALGIREKILSPTFVLIHKHKLANGKKQIANSQFKNLYHIDAYRLKSEKDLLKLGVKEIFENPENIVLIEWADRVRKIIPRNAAWIYFDHLENHKRKITIKYG
ncbi:MAG: tRNA (adenosine(37)-N6)-threonylcarbamoyltransferase complex ATPase subunit type 1 TsaE [Parcubacteria group bacterium]|nr:tRNA (adenosine(37)-N6)-threonylcarbamoyltransferase complex ATPase subunit type 1 TsaE [Parcubacteria group bacterium]